MLVDGIEEIVFKRLCVRFEEGTTLDCRLAMIDAILEVIDRGVAHWHFRHIGLSFHLGLLTRYPITDRPVLGSVTRELLVSDGSHMLQCVLPLFKVREDVLLQPLQLDQIFRCNVAAGRLSSNELKGLSLVGLLFELHDPADGSCDVLVTSGELICNDLVYFSLLFLLDIVALGAGQFDGIMLYFDHVLQTD